MRTAITIAENHGGTELLVAGRKVPIQKQLADFRALRSLRSHPDFKTVQYQEKDGHALSITFPTPEKLAAADKLRAAETAENEAYLAKLATAGAERKSAADSKRAKESAEVVKAHSANIEKIKLGQSELTNAIAEVKAVGKPKTSNAERPTLNAEKPKAGTPEGGTPGKPAGPALTN